MLEKLISYFAERHLLCNLVVLLVLAGGVIAWHHTNKEELPDITFDRVRISTRYPGATAQDVEYLVTKPIEEVVRGLDGVYRVESTSSIGESNITVEIEKNYPDIQEAFGEIKNAALDVDLPAEVLDDPSIRVFKTSKKAILDIAIIPKEKHLLDVAGRRELQQIALALENQLLGLPAVNSVNRDGYLRPEIHIRADPVKLTNYLIPFNTVMNEVRRNHVRKPAGNIEAPSEPKVTLLSELDTEAKLAHLVIQGGFEGQVIRLGEVADIEESFEKSQTVLKVNGREGIIFSVVKNSSSGILEALDQVEELVENFRKNNLEGSDIEIVLLDDESIDIRNRLSLISINGTMGFILILATLFACLNKKAGFWVAMGIPFTICATLIGGMLMGFTINGTTLAAVIIVMGMVVDDAIVIAENISRLISEGMEPRRATIVGASTMALPVLASIVTTCVAFIPLFFFQGRYGEFIKFIPPIIFLMLGASLFESIFILPSHMNSEFPRLNMKFLPRMKAGKPREKGHWFDKVEARYEKMLGRVLHHRIWVFGVFVLLLMAAGVVGTTHMKFVMFPNEETRDIVLMGEAEPGTTRYETARLTKQIENVIDEELGDELVGYRTEIAESRRGGAVEENKFRMIVEIVPKEDRKKSADQIVQQLKARVDKLEGFKKVAFQKSRRGSGSGSPIEILIQENQDKKRSALAAEVAEVLRKHPALMNVEIEEGLRVPEYRVEIDRDTVKRLSIDPTDVAATFRAALEGTVLYEFFNGEEDVYVRFSILEEAKTDIEKVLSLPVENQGNYLVPLKDIVKVEEIVSPSWVARRNMKRTAFVYADLKKGTSYTPLEIAEELEAGAFPKLLSKYSSSLLSFDGEVKDTRESKDDFRNAIIMVTFLIYVILAILFNSMTKPLIIMLAIPFGVVGIVLAFWLHGKDLFGFYAAVGALGLAGVVINDSIIMLVQLDEKYDESKPREASAAQIAAISKTRLRAVMLTTVTTVAGVLPTAYGFAGYDAMLAEMMLALAWGLLFGTFITLLLIPCLYSFLKDLRFKNPLTAAEAL